MRSLFLISFFFLSACISAGTYRIADQNLSLVDLKKAVTAVIGEPRAVSENQRTFLSQYFSRKPDPKFDPQKSKERLYAKVAILGDRRPYDVEVEVLVEEKDRIGYALTGNDSTEAKKLGKDIRARLNQGREDRNVIDDFRAF
jgi:hypothetical protein